MKLSEVPVQDHFPSQQSTVYNRSFSAVSAFTDLVKSLYVSEISSLFDTYLRATYM